MRFTQILRSTTSAAVVATAAFGLAGVAQAQVTSVDEIVVTAQLREQSLQEVPIVVTTLSEELLKSAGVHDIKDLQILTPGMTVTSTQSEASTTARIRGVGTVGDNPGLESSVGVVIDGVYRSRNGVGFGDLGEMSRIEVLKGPQGTLFGKNTSAGVINIITAAPSFTPGFEAEVTAGNFSALGVAASVTGPISEQIAGRLYIAKRERDGFYDVDTSGGPRTNTDDQNQDFWTARGQLLILPSDTASIRLIADYSKRDEYCCLGVVTRSSPTAAFINYLTAPNGPGTAAQGPGDGRVPFSRLAYANHDTDQVMEDMGFSAEVNVDIPSWNAVFTSVSSYRDWSTVNGMDIDYTGADIMHRNADGDYGYGLDNLTQEFRLAGTSDRFDWLVGAFATKENIERTDSYVFGSDYNAFISFLLTASVPAAQGGPNPGRIGCFTNPGGFLVSGPGFPAPMLTPLCAIGAVPPSAAAPQNIVGQGVQDSYSQRTQSFALFTNNTWRVTDQFDITLGLRYTRDEKRLLGLQNNINGNGAACMGALANNQALAGGPQPGPIPGTLVVPTPAAAVGALCLPWANPMYANRSISESHDNDAISGTIKAAYRPTDNIMVYASYAKGYKGFGYNMDRVQTGVTPDASLFFEDETVDSYELGIKTTLADRTVLLNATYFDQTFENFQLNTFLGTAFVVESIPELTSRGVDMDFVWFTPVEGLSFQGGLTYTDAAYGDFTAADLINASRFPQLSLLPGARPSFAPEWSASGSIAFDRSLGNGLRGGFSLSAKYQTEYNTGSDLIPFKMQDSFTVVNGRVTIGSETGNWALDVWGQNLFDTEYIQVAYNSPLQGTAFQTAVQPDGSFYNQAADTQGISAFLGQPRTYGVTLRVSY